MTERRRFRAMNTDVEIVAVGCRQSAPLTSAERVFHEIEARCSRSLAGSELSRLNACSGCECEVSPHLLQLLERAVYFHRITGGVFDPAVPPALEAAGYDRSFERIAPTADALPPAPEHHASIADLRIDGRRRTVTTPRGMWLDLGDIARGHAVDAAAHALTPARDFLINAGGDVFASGNGPHGVGWPVAVSDPAREEYDVDIVILRDEALATSTVARRPWQRGDARHTRIIDPRTASPVDNPVVSASVVAPTATEADVFATTALRLGTGEGTRFLEKRNARGLFILADGAVHRTARWPGRAAPPVTSRSTTSCNDD